MDREAFEDAVTEAAVAAGIPFYTVIYPTGHKVCVSGWARDLSKFVYAEQVKAIVVSQLPAIAACICNLDVESN